MGICPAPSIAIIFFAIHEEFLMSKWSGSIMFYLRFIDDVFGIWLSNPNYVADNRQWNNFQDDVNDFHGLPWEFIPRSTTVQFMDLTVSIEGGMQLQIFKFETYFISSIIDQKPSYIPPLEIPKVWWCYIIGLCGYQPPHRGTFGLRGIEMAG
mmetsp:Transcript_33801/g.68790  ORF Transcript_33801/g.68790 Transcript_33801/m.68790 type:complete len:153 (-) Transcript_33801:1879-2337(-)